MIRPLSPYHNEILLVQDLSRGEPKAQKYLYEKYDARMLALCTRYVGNRMEAEDVMIDGFMKVFDKIRQYQSQGSFEGWIKRIMVNESLMVVRSRKTIAVDVEEAIDQPDYSSSIGSNLEAEELLKIIEELPDGYRTVFNLYAIEGYSHAEISQLMGISEGTSKSQLSRARVILQQKVLKRTEKFG